MHDFHTLYACVCAKARERERERERKRLCGYVYSPLFAQLRLLVLIRNVFIFVLSLKKPANRKRRRTRRKKTSRIFVDSFFLSVFFSWIYICSFFFCLGLAFHRNKKSLYPYLEKHHPRSREEEYVISISDYHNCIGNEEGRSREIKRQREEWRVVYLFTSRKRRATIL